MMLKVVRENIIYILIAHMAVLVDPTIVFAQNANYSPINFTQVLSTDRGKLTPLSMEGFYLNEQDTCDFMTKKMGWSAQDCPSIDKLIGTPSKSMDSIIVTKAISDGYVELDDWSGDIAGTIEALQQEAIAGMAAQSERLGVTVKFDGWLLFPHVDKSRSIMYFAQILNWNGERTVNVIVTFFDRYGYVTIRAVPNVADTREDVAKIVDEVYQIYTSQETMSYTAFQAGDKVAAYGAVGVFATLLGVKYGKAAGAGIFALAAIFLKKLWFLLLAPLAFIGRLFLRKSPNKDA